MLKVDEIVFSPMKIIWNVWPSSEVISFLLGSLLEGGFDFGLASKKTVDFEQYVCIVQRRVKSPLIISFFIVTKQRYYGHVIIYFWCFVSYF